MPWKLRVLVWAQLGRRVAPSAVAANIADVIKAYAPKADVPMPCQRRVQIMRGELSIASEAIAAFRVALCKRIVSFGWDESTKFGLGLLSSNTQIETADGNVVDVVMRGATLTAGGTAEVRAASPPRVDSSPPTPPPLTALPPSALSPDAAPRVVHVQTRTLWATQLLARTACSAPLPEEPAPISEQTGGPLAPSRLAVS